VIAHLANRSFIVGRIPTLLKVGLVTTLLKHPGLDTSDYKNFRPIINLTTDSKIFERLALALLKPHIVSSPNYCPLQSEYRSAHSTETALVKMVDDILGCMDSGSVAVVLGLDISAAFDTVFHQTLLGRLELEFGIHGVSPEGSVLGPILFTTYIAPIGRLIEQHGMHYHKYADDTQLYTSLTVPAD